MEDKISGFKCIIQLLWPIRCTVAHCLPRSGYVRTYLNLEVIFHTVKVIVINFLSTKTFGLYVRSDTF